jgi:hypothetical protein
MVIHDHHASKKKQNISSGFSVFLSVGHLGKRRWVTSEKRRRNEDGARGSGTRTVIEIQCANKGIPLFIYGRFFKNFPNWKYAFTLGDRSERVFVTNITLQNVGIPLEEKYKIELRGLFQEIALLDADIFGKGDIRIGQDTMSFTVHGILKKLEVIRQIILILTGVADRIESAPIV